MTKFIIHLDFDKKIEIDQDSIYYLVIGGQFAKNPPIVDMLISITQLSNAYFIFKKVGLDSDMHVEHMDIIIPIDKIKYIETKEIQFKEDNIEE